MKTPSRFQDILNFQYWVNGILAAIVSIFGFTGNFVSIYVLLQPNMRNSFNQLLIALCVSDSFFICCNFLRAGSAINMGQTPGGWRKLERNQSHSYIYS